MFGKKTLDNVLERAIEIGNDYKIRLRNGENLRVCISKGNKKIGRVMNVSLMPIITCANCAECKKLCYDIKACFQYKGVIPARMRNTILMRENIVEYFHQIDVAMTRRKKNKYFRWHVAGDIPTMEYFENMIDLAAKHPDFVIWTYTKNYSLVNEYVSNHGGFDCLGFRSNGTVFLKVAPNLSIMFSEWRGLPLVNPYGFPVFSVVFKDDKVKPDPKKNHYCPGNCDICKAKKRGCPYGENTFANEH